jgi:hypothetical protein
LRPRLWRGWLRREPQRPGTGRRHHQQRLPRPGPARRGLCPGYNPAVFLAAGPPPPVERTPRILIPHQASTGSVDGPGCNGFLFKYGACPSERGAAGTTPQEVRSSALGALGVVLGALPIGGDLLDLALGSTGEDTAIGDAARFITNSSGDTLDTSRVTIPEGKFGYLLKNPSKAGIFSDSMASIRILWKRRCGVISRRTSAT